MRWGRIKVGWGVVGETAAQPVRRPLPPSRLNMMRPEPRVERRKETWEYPERQFQGGGCTRKTSHLWLGPRSGAWGGVQGRAPV